VWARTSEPVDPKEVLARATWISRAIAALILAVFSLLFFLFADTIGSAFPLR
jgi:hypothetical protein